MRKTLSKLLILALCGALCLIVGCGKPPHVHAYNQKIATQAFIASDATCLNKAEYYYSCECGQKGTETFEYGDELGHSYGDWVSNGNGTHTKTCAHDSLHSITENCTGGTATCTEQATCETCGNKYGDLKGHEYNVLKKSDTEHWYECVCGAYETKENHKGGTATCTEQATCATCGNEYGDLKDHEYNTLKKSDTEHWYECVCGAYETKENHKPGVAATETTDQTCTVCGHIITPALGHVHTAHLTKVDAKPQSCTKEGNTLYYTCSCGKWFTDDSSNTEITDKTSVIIRKDNHQYNTLKKSETQHWYECECGDKSGIENHKGGTATCQVKANCSICNESYGNFGDHIYSTTWSKDKTHHWKECGCGAKDSYAEHNLVDGACDTCGNKTQSQGLKFTLLSDNTYEVSVGDCRETQIVIPATYDGKAVTKIAERAFSGNANLIGVVIPESVTSVKNQAFSNCVNLKDIQLPDTLVYIGISAFERCEALKTMNIPAGVSQIDERAFARCNSLQSINLARGSKLKVVGEKAFSDCANLQSISLYEVNYLTSFAKDAFDGSNFTQVDYKGGIEFLCKVDLSCLNLWSKELYLDGAIFTQLIVPEGITEIKENAFANCKTLEKVVLPSSVIKIGNGAFLNCGALKTVKIPSEIVEIGDGAFERCDALTYNQKNGLNYLGNDENSCVYLVGATSKNIAVANIDDNCKIIRREALYNCTALTSVSIPNSVKKIGEFAFSDCTSLKNIKVASGNVNYCSIDGNLYDKNATALLQYAIGKTQVAFTMPNTVIEIHESAFSWCSALVRIELSKNVQSIDACAFWGCTSLESVVIPDGALSIGDNAFDYCISLMSVVIPESVQNIGYYAFADCDLVTIYCEASEKPNSWSKYWNSAKAPVCYKGQWVYVNGVPMATNIK